jgi:hypothetical protein
MTDKTLLSPGVMTAAAGEAFTSFSTTDVTLLTETNIIHVPASVIPLPLSVAFSDVGDGYFGPTMFVEILLQPPIILSADFSDTGDGYHAPAMLIEPIVTPPILLTAEFSDVGDGYFAPSIIMVPSIGLNLSAPFSDVSSMTATPTILPPILLTADFSDVGDGYHAPAMFVEISVHRDLGHLVVAFDDGATMGISQVSITVPPPPIINQVVIIASTL